MECTCKVIFGGVCNVNTVNNLKINIRLDRKNFLLYIENEIVTNEEDCLLCLAIGINRPTKNKIVEDIYCKHNDIFLSVGQCADLELLVNMGNLSAIRTYLSRIDFDFIY